MVLYDKIPIAAVMKYLQYCYTVGLFYNHVVLLCTWSYFSVLRLVHNSGETLVTQRLLSLAEPAQTAS